MKYLLILTSIFFIHLNSYALEYTPSDSLSRDSLVFREVNIPLEIVVSCEDLRYKITWHLDHLDSLDLPHHLELKGYRFEEEDTIKTPYRTQKIDSNTLYRSPYILISPPGYFWLEGVDSTRLIHYSSDQVFIDLCALFQLPDRFQLSGGKMYQPKNSQNIQKIELVIFDALGNEVFSTKNPHFNWDGRNTTTTEQCVPGSYFYHCDVWEIHGSEIIKKNITGIIEIIL